MATWASDELPPCEDDDDTTTYDDDAIPADGVLLQRGGTGPAGESIAMETGQAPSLYVVIHNIKSSDNVGQLIRTAGAFGAKEVLVVSAERTARRMRKNLRTFGAHGTDSGKDTTTGVSADELGAYLSTNVGTKQRTEKGDREQLIDGRAIDNSPILRTTKTASGVVDVVEIAPCCTTKEQSVSPKRNGRSQSGASRTTGLCDACAHGYGKQNELQLGTRPASVTVDAGPDCCERRLLPKTLGLLRLQMF